MRKELHQANRLSWNAATRAHNSHKGDLAKYLREGRSTLFPEELGLLGDVRGRSLVHLPNITRRHGHHRRETPREEETKHVSS